jgi:hypothetical protein
MVPMLYGDILPMAEKRTIYLSVVSSMKSCPGGEQLRRPT